MKFQSEWLGLIDYQIATNLQMKIGDDVREKKDGVVLGLEHPTVVTLGKSAQQEELEFYRRIFPHVEKSDRGGRATLHSPGQLVIYPLFPVRDWQLSVRDFVCGLETAVLKTLADLQISAFRKPNQVGIFTDRGKIASLGVRVDRGVSRHGISINVSNDLSLFNQIVVCGVEGQEMDSVSIYGCIESTEQVFELFLSQLASVFSLTGRPQIQQITCSDSPAPLAQLVRALP